MRHTVKKYSVQEGGMKFWSRNENRIKKCLSLLTPKNIINSEFIRVGNPFGDGGYVMLKNFLENTKNGIAYSIGVETKATWELDMAERFGFDSYMYDHTVNKSPVVHPNLHFKKIGLSYINEAPFQTLDKMIEENGHENRDDLVLACDIEGGEWLFLPAIQQSTLTKFSQLSFEFHWFLRLCTDNNMFELLERSLKKLSENFVPVHIHGNNNTGWIEAWDTIIPDVLEITYVRKDLAEFGDKRLKFPTRFDAPIAPMRNEIEIGHFELDQK